jgi:dTDP-glucose 4,6-dehydratase
MILDVLGKPESLIQPVEGLRPGHDQRYAVDTSRIRALGWQPELDLRGGMEKTAGWYRERRDWWEPIRSGAYREYYEKHYGAALKS